MPIYAYKCSDCGFQKDFLRKISDPPLTTCTECGKETFQKMLTAAGFQLKGSGWYVTDFRNNGAKPEAKSGDVKKGGNTGDTGKSDSKGESSGDASAKSDSSAKTESSSGGSDSGKSSDSSPSTSTSSSSPSSSSSTSNSSASSSSPTAQA